MKLAPVQVSKVSTDSCSSSSCFAWGFHLIDQSSVSSMSTVILVAEIWLILVLIGPGVPFILSKICPEMGKYSKHSQITLTSIAHGSTQVLAGFGCKAA